MKTALKTDQVLFFSFLGLLSIISAALGFYNEKYYICLLPFVAMGVYWSIQDYRVVYYLLLLSLPFSIPFMVGSSNIDLPSEPLMICLLGLSLILLVVNKDIDTSFLRHPVTLLLATHFAWMIFVSIFSVNILHSVKYLLSKAWYIGAFYFFTCILFTKIEDFRKIFWCLFAPLLLVILYTLIRHYKMGMNFETANSPMNPFYLNHVIYSTILVIFLPFTVFAFYNRNYNFNVFGSIALGFGIILMVVAIGFSYTRASWLGIPLAIVTFIAMKNNLMKISLVLCGISLIVSVIYLSWNYKFMDYAPDFNKTIFHKGDIEGHLEATYKMEDVSGMERVYRWVAAKRMFEDKPILGSGPSTFYPEYKKYTLYTFHTYVSDNPEMSSTHNYFLMVLCEQGILGFILFTSISVFLIIMGSRIYRNSLIPEHKNLAMACTVSLVIFYFHLMLNDLVETDKIGSLFFIAMAILVKLDLWTKAQQGIPELRK